MKDSLTIGETAEMFGIAASALRYYEDEGLMEPVPRNRAGRRVYGPKELRRIRFILTLRNAGIPVDAIRRYVDLFYEGSGTIPVRKQILTDHLNLLKEEAAQLNEVIRQLEEIIETYEDTLMKREMDSRRSDPAYGKRNNGNS